MEKSFFGFLLSNVAERFWSSMTILRSLSKWCWISILVLWTQKSFVASAYGYYTFRHIWGSEVRYAITSLRLSTSPSSSSMSSSSISSSNSCCLLSRAVMPAAFRMDVLIPCCIKSFEDSAEDEWCNAESPSLSTALTTSTDAVCAASCNNHFKTGNWE